MTEQEIRKTARLLMERAQFDCYGCMDGKSSNWQCPQCGRTINEASASVMPVMRSLPSREQIRKVIELTTMVDPDGTTWGMDTDCGNIEDRINDALVILRGNDV